MSHTGFKTSAEALKYLTGGNATVTIQSAKTGTHFTFKVKHAYDRATNKIDRTSPLFVKVLNGPSNESDYMYLGLIGSENQLVAGRKGHPDAPSFKAFDWTLRQLHGKAEIPADVVIRHEGSCCMCGRKLTRPESIDSGIGPECASKMGG